jgi:hypothetical protein
MPEVDSGFQQEIFRDAIDRVMPAMVQPKGEMAIDCFRAAWTVSEFESYQVFTPLPLASAMDKVKTGRIDGRTVKTNQISK